MNSLKLVLLSFLVCQFAVAQRKQIIFPPQVLSDGNPEFVNFCELPQYKNHLVYTRFIYTWLDLGWFIKSPDEKCVSFYANLYLGGNVFLNPKFIAYVKSVHNSTERKYLIVDAFGILENNNLLSYESTWQDTKTTKYNFSVIKVVNVQQVKLVN